MFDRLETIRKTEDRLRRVKDEKRTCMDINAANYLRADIDYYQSVLAILKEEEYKIYQVTFFDEDRYGAGAVNRYSFSTYEEAEFFYNEHVNDKDKTGMFIACLTIKGRKTKFEILKGGKKNGI